MRRDARCARLIETHVEGERDAIGTELLEPASHLLRFDERGAADHHPGDAELEHLRNRGGVAQTAAHLQSDAGLGGEIGDDRAIAAASLARAVEIDHVQPIGAVIAIFGEQRMRLDVIVRDRRKVALQQSDAASVLQVDGGYEAQVGRSSRKRQKILQQARSDCRGALRVKLRAVEISPLHTSAEGLTVAAPRDGRAAHRQRVTVHEIGVVAIAQSREQGQSR